MRRLLLLLVLAPALAQAELYRWVDRESGSVKFSNTPPPWYGDPEKARGAPPVEVIPYRGPGGTRAPAAPAGATAAASRLAALEARWAELLRFFASLPPTTDFSRAGTGLQQQLEAYQGLVAELDRLDPAGAARRRARAAQILETLRKGLELAR